MSRFFTVLTLASLALLVPFAHAQETETSASLSQKAITALKAKKFDEGADLLLRILKLPGYEKDSGTAYNLACAYSLKGDVEKGFEWLGKSVDWGWGSGSGTLVDTTKQITHAEMAKTDPDLEALRKDPRFEKLMERMTKAGVEREAKKKKGEEYAATAARYIPEKVAGMAEMPVLVVLHDAGSTKDEVVKGRWKEIADELGFALIAPSGTVLVGDEPEKGMTWFADAAEYKQGYWKFEKPVNDAVSAFKKEHPLDKARVVVAGEGIGALVALNVAIGSPGTFKGAIALNGGVNADIMAAKAPTAGKMGLRTRILFDEKALATMMHDAAARAAVDSGGTSGAGSTPEKEAAEGKKLLDSWSKSLQTWGIASEVKAFTPDAADPAQVKKLVVEAVKAVTTPVAAAATPPSTDQAKEAGSPKKE